MPNSLQRHPKLVTTKNPVEIRDLNPPLFVFFQLDDREAGPHDAQLVHPNRGQHVSRISGRRDVEPEHEAGRGLPLPQHRSARTASGREKPDSRSSHGEFPELSTAVMHYQLFGTIEQVSNAMLYK